ncbi:ABC transporter permease subunit [Limisalsivibrio acetivorans]|uniref:ABC transporter permease subunit n=1 Tax=Limisalsivibrio acetivorans TaxID=1304888 RepID=UPI0003B3D962|nr:branched-chain amino acid ABC transporter permease [Limisalsivibrio acetivorans]
MNGIFNEIKRSALVAVWFMFLTFPILVIKVNTIENTIIWRWSNLIYVAVGTFFGSWLWRWMEHKKTHTSERNVRERLKMGVQNMLVDNKKILLPIIGLVTAFCIVFPMVFNSYQVSILTTALMYIVLGLGLNIVVGLAGLLDLGYVAFYAVGAYSYALLNMHFGISFWIALPIGAALAMLFGIILGFPVLRLRGDYLAIVTLGFGEIIRLVLENWNDFSQGPSGVAGIPRPQIWGVEMDLGQATIFLYYLVLVLVVVTIFSVNRLQNSRIGRAWLALREDEIACQAMGIDKTKTKLTAFALGATWAGIMGVVFAAKTTFINPASFTFLESAIILSVVVLGGMGSILGVILGALILILLPEYLRAFSEFRMLIFGGSMVLMMVFRPQGLISNVRRKYLFHKENLSEVEIHE